MSAAHLRPRPPVDLRTARAHWLTPELLAFPATALPADTPVASLDWQLRHAPAGGLDVRTPDPGALRLVPDPAGLPPEVLERVPHLAGCLALRLDHAGASRARDLVLGQLAVVAHAGKDTAGEASAGESHGGKVVLATSVQLPHLLDHLYPGAPERSYGPVWSGTGPSRVPTVAVWAPTAHRVTLLLWDGHPEPDREHAWSPPGEPTSYPMDRDRDGVWSVRGAPDWADRCYQLEVTALRPGEDAPSTVRSTDPWSVGLAIDSTHSVLVDLDDPRWAPPVWRTTTAPALRHPVDQTIYELHVRDFSRDDPAVPEELRGSYLAFGVDGHGRRHLRRLADAGLNTVHLLPVFDLTSVQEDPALQAGADVHRLRELSEQDPAGTAQQELVRAAALRDAFNWGYDPWHFLAPEGSYARPAAAAHGGRRVAQCREMVGELHRSGLRVVLDQVYNHTTDSGLGRASVLDRVVPGYYHRLDQEGRVETSTCCQNTATEHRMAEKLMVDGCVLWARHYRVDGFRFDLMGHHSRATMEAVRRALDALTVEDHGVDGSAVTLYGEGWDFGEVAGNARFHQAVQGQLAGTAIGTFNDRLRDAVRGGRVHDQDPRSGLGFATGGLDPRDTDLLQVGLAGGLADLELVSQATGRTVHGRAVPYGDSGQGAYASSPEEVVNYVDAHDNETLWDTLVLKLPVGTPMAERVRRTILALATVTLSQGICFWHAGTEILRSKSLDRNSYASGDWFNGLDLTLQDNGFGRGLPPRPDNGPRWPVMAPLLADETLRPGPEDIEHALEMALDLLRLRRDLPLLRLGRADLVLDRVSFPVSGSPHGRPDVVAMLVVDDGPDPELHLDPLHSGLLVVLNAAANPVDQALPALQGQRWELAPVQRDGADPLLGAVSWDPDRAVLHLPPVSAVVLVRPR